MGSAFFAKCEDIEIEHGIRLFLDTIDKELAKYNIRHFQGIPELRLINWASVS